VPLTLSKNRIILNKVVNIIESLTLTRQMPLGGEKNKKMKKNFSYDEKRRCAPKTGNFLSR
jgi:predicted oxidoreductase (fatty acid repression mutant protein)